ncbi:MAG: LysM peptidoglycan-binding domain-containing protein, partial [Pseudomonadales bacterium]|nr:LysM peptidoglycan-binding domain-containing protein [Pseudomonadales bacterium]
MSSGVYTTAIDDLINGFYEYQLVGYDENSDIVTLNGGGNTGVFSVGTLLKTETLSSNQDASLLTPLRVAKFDLLGNKVSEVAYSNGAISEESGNPRSLDLVNDRHKYWLFKGKTLKSYVDAEQNRKEYSFDSLGNVAKLYSYFEDFQGVNKTTASLYRYDRVGQNISTQNLQQFLLNNQIIESHNYATNYNAFGEMESLFADGVLIEKFSYDRNGNAWKNSKDAISRINYYDLQNNLSVVVSDKNTELEQQGYQALDGLISQVGSSNVNRYVYNNINQVSRDERQDFVLNLATSSIDSQLSLTQDALSYEIVERATVESDDDSSWFVGETAIRVDWEGLEGLGSGDIRVVAKVRQRYSTSHSGTLTETHTNYFDGSQSGGWFRLDSVSVTSIDWLKVEKYIDGQWVQVLHSDSSNSFDSAVLQWQKPALEGTVVKLEYRAAGTQGNYSQLATVLRHDAYYRADLSGLPNGNYEYRLSYTREGELEPYAQADGAIVLSASTNAGSTQSVITVDRADLDYHVVEEAAIEYDDDGDASFDGDSIIRVNWSDLSAFGNGDIRVRANVTERFSPNGSWTQTNNYSRTFDGGADGGWFYVSNAIVKDVNWVAVEKNIDGQWITVRDSRLNIADERLIVMGNTSAVTHVYAKNESTGVVTSVAVSALGASAYSADTTSLAQGVYSFSSNGNADTFYGQSFVSGNGAGGIQVSAHDQRVEFQLVGQAGIDWDDDGNDASFTGDNVIRIDWGGITGLGNGDVRVIADVTEYYNAGQSHTRGETYTNTYSANEEGVWFKVSGSKIKSVNTVRIEKYVNGQWVQIKSSQTTNTDRLLIDTPSATESDIGFIGIRPKGANIDFVQVTGTKLANGLYAIDASNLGFGEYEYQVVTQDSAGNTQQTYTGTYFVRGNGNLTVSDIPAVRSTFTPTKQVETDRWGNVISETDARGDQIRTEYRYDHNNNQVATILPETSVWTETGTEVQATPTTYHYYDENGLKVATKDANSNFDQSDTLTTFEYNALGLLVKQTQADGGEINKSYNAFGELYSENNTRQYVTYYNYDRNGQLVQVDNPVYSEEYTYNELGNRIAHKNGEDEVTNYRYDANGNVVYTLLHGGSFTSTDYDALNRKVSESNALAHTQTWVYTNNQLSSYKDLGDNTFTYTYNYLGQVETETGTNGKSLSYSYYENGRVQYIYDNAIGTETYFEYDEVGNVTRERFTNMVTRDVYQDVRTTYDEHNRVSTVEDNRYSMAYRYDANGNRRHTYAAYYDNDSNLQEQDYWYTYDAMNRIKVSQGELDTTSNTIVITSDQGVELHYDGEGNRTTARRYKDNNIIHESYTFDALNRIATTSQDGVLTSERIYDDANRVYRYTEYDNGTVKSHKAYQYEGPGLLNILTSYRSKVESESNREYKINNNYDSAGNKADYEMRTYKTNGSTNYVNDYDYTYLRYGGSYKERVIDGESTYFSDGDTTSTYDVNGNLVSVDDRFGSDNYREFFVNTKGVILQKHQNGKIQYYYYANGKPVGTAGDLEDMDFDYNYTPVSSSYPSISPSSYVVAEGDTLQSIALSVYGDETRWYLIADANGLSANSDLKIGQTLKIPNSVTNIHNNADTFKPYNPSEIIGDTTPTLPEPPAVDDSCGVKQLVVVVVAVIVGYVTGQWEIASEWIKAVVVATASSVAAQLTAKELGLQDEFSWEQVAFAAATAGLFQGAGLNESLNSAFGNEGFWSGFAAGAIKNAYSQAIGSALNVQERVDWRGLVIAGASSGVQSYVRTNYGNSPNIDDADINASNDADSARAKFEYENIIKPLSASMERNIVSSLAAGVVQGQLTKHLYDT